ncbi:hypothetical protein BKA65DRAFT_539741 [Rhexocercosporidium sp. MPI-PUGE-AT-0058]|nr:hypothetical protein BKA65DRAFT_539741 [Rhexocercosporidium sp. MPI-PUGE-AT-0058]
MGGTFIPHRKESTSIPVLANTVTRSIGNAGDKEQGRFLYQRVLNHDTAANLLQNLVSKTNADRKWLEQQYREHGAALEGLWIKKSIGDRKRVLLQCYHGIYPSKFSEGDLAYKYRIRIYGKETRPFRDIFMRPYINLEDLSSRPEIFLGLAANHVNISSENWVVFDMKILRNLWSQGSLEVLYNSGAVIMYGARYGELVKWIPEAAHRADTMGFPRAHLVLETQSTIMKFVRVVFGVLATELDANVGTSQKSASKVPRSPPNMGLPFLDEPYGPCPVFCWDKLHSIVQAQLSLTSDHVRHLQTDPAYLLRYINVAKQGHFAANGLAGTFLSIIPIDLHRDVCTAQYWGWIVEEVKSLRDLHARFRDSIFPGEPLPKKYGDKFAALEALVLALIESQSKHTRATYPQRPGFQEGYKFKYVGDTDTRTGFFELKANTRTDLDMYPVDKLDWYVYSVTESPQNIRGIDHTRLFSSIDDYINNCEAKERARLDETLQRNLSDLASLHEMLIMLKSHRPRATPEDISKYKVTRSSRGWQYIVAAEDPSGGAIWPLVDEASWKPKRVQFLSKMLASFERRSIPHLRADQENIENQVAMHNRLHLFWIAARKTDWFFAYSKRPLTKIVQVDRESSEFTPETPLDERRDVLEIESILPVRKNPQKPRQPRQQREKYPDNGLPFTVLPRYSGAIVLAAKADILEALLPLFTHRDTENKGAGKPVLWRDFQKAMCTIGFDVQAMGKGSLFSFKPNSTSPWYGKPKLILHRPVNFYDRIQMLKLGNRFADHYGWNSGSFVLKY